MKLKYPNIAASAYDLSNANNRNSFLKSERQKSFSAAYSEVVFSDIIPKEAVSVEFMVGIGNVGDCTNTEYSLSRYLLSDPLQALMSSQFGDGEVDISHLLPESTHTPPAATSPSTSAASRIDSTQHTLAPNSPATPFSDRSALHPPSYTSPVATDPKEVYPTSSPYSQPLYSDSSGSSHKGTQDTQGLAHTPSVGRTSVPPIIQQSVAQRTPNPGQGEYIDSLLRRLDLQQDLTHNSYS